MKDDHTSSYDLGLEAGRGRGSRSATVSVRLDPKLRYFAELAARKQRRTISSYVEWAIEENLRSNGLLGFDGPSFADQMNNLWDVDESDRFAKLAFAHPDLLTHEEQIRWKLICENGSLWIGRFWGASQEWTWTPSINSLIFPKLREHWDIFCKVARFELSKEQLPSWQKFKVKDEGDEVPF
jgi:hypothetical protein